MLIRVSWMESARCFIDMLRVSGVVFILSQWCVIHHPLPIFVRDWPRCEETESFSRSTIWTIEIQPLPCRDTRHVSLPKEAIHVAYVHLTL